jgi:5-hydroxyisourate hydrolase-like protein (transthyretin family)
VFDLDHAFAGFAQVNGGQYEVKELRPGSYKIYFQDDLGSSGTYISEWYHDAAGYASFDDALPVTLATPGETITVDEDLDELVHLGRIAGTVTDASTGLPLSGIEVTVYDIDGNSKGTASTGSDGQYITLGLDDGFYVLSFQDPYGYHCTEWLHNSPGFDQAIPLEVTSGSTTAGDEDLVLGAKVEGTVTDASTGLPIEGISVYVSDAQGNLAGSGYTDDSGMYSVKTPPGSYMVRFADDYARYVEEYYWEKADLASSDEIQVFGGVTTTLNHEQLSGIVLLGTISGVVTDAVTGDPLPMIFVSVFDLDINFVAFDVTDPAGYYEVGNLEPGLYLVWFEIGSVQAGQYKEEWYHNAPWYDSAQQVLVTSGGVTTVNEDLVPWGRIAGTVTDASSGDPLEGIRVEVRDQSNTLKGQSTTDADGRYTVGHLESGTYKVYFYDDSQTYAHEWYHDALIFESATTVDVTIGEEMTVNEDLWVGSTIQGTVTDASSGNPIPGGISVWVFDLDHAFAGFAQVNGGQYEVKELRPGSYKIYFQDDLGSSGTYISEWYHDAAGYASFDDALPVTLATPGETITVDEDLETFINTVTAFVSGGYGSVDPSSQTVEHGASVTIYIYPGIGYHIASITDNGGSVPVASPYVISGVTRNHEISVTFAIDTFTINATAGPGGTITPSGAVLVDYGNDQAFAIASDAGYHIEDVVVDGISVGVPNSHTFYSVTTNHEISVTFAIDTFTIAVTADPTEGGSVSGGGVYNYGQTVNLSAMANAGYHFVNWTEDGQEVSATAAYSFTATANRTLVARLAIDTFTISATADPTEGGSVSGGGTYSYGQSVNLSANANVGYHFVNWTEDGQEVSTDAAHSFTATADRTLVAHFAIDTITITATAGTGGTITPSGILMVNWGASQSFAIAPDAGYHIADVLVDGGSVGAVSSYEFTSVTANRTISATFAEDEHTLVVTISGNGSVTMVPDQAVYPHGAEVTLTATADSGWVFTGWSGDLSGNDNPITITVNGDKAITATFAKVQKVNTVTWVFSSVNPSVYGQRVTLVALVLPGAWGSGMPSGTVTFMDGEATLGTGTLNRWGLASFSTSSLSVGKHLITAAYDGDADFNSSTSSTLSQRVNKASTTKLVSSANPSVSGQLVTFTATVSAAELGTGTPTGTVTFKDGDRVLGTATLDASGKASYSTKSLSVGTHSITAVYNGDDNYSGSTSSVLTQYVKRR